MDICIRCWVLFRFCSLFVKEWVKQRLLHRTPNNSVRIFFSLIVMLLEETAWNRNDLKLQLVKLCSRRGLVYSRCVAICLLLHGGHLKTRSYIIAGNRHVLCGGRRKWIRERGRRKMMCSARRGYDVVLCSLCCSRMSCWIVFSRSMTHIHTPKPYSVWGMGGGISRYFHFHPIRILSENTSFHSVLKKSPKKGFI
jgi:hypothetical protein